MLMITNELLGFCVEYSYELVADYLAFLFRISNAGELGKKLCAGICRDQIQPKSIAQIGLNLSKFILPEYAVVHEDTSETLADGAIDQHSRNRGIHSAGESTNCVSVPDGVLDGGNGFVDKALRCPNRLGMADIENEISQQIGPELGVMDLRVKLHCPGLALGIFNGCQSA